jgi:hypothetical protein
MIRSGQSLTASLGIAVRVMRLAPVSARKFSTPTPTGTTDDLRRAAAVEFGVHLTGGSWAPPERMIDNRAYAYILQEAEHHNACFLDVLHIFVRADTDR